MSLNPKARLHRPVEALRRLQDLSGAIGVASGDRNENRDAQLRMIAKEMFDICVAALDGGPLPDARDWRKAI